MKLQLLVAAVGQTAKDLPNQMNIGSDAIIVNQTDHYDYQEFDYKGHQVKFYSVAERGVGLSRNHSLLRAQADISLFADEDIAYLLQPRASRRRYRSIKIGKFYLFVE